MPDQSALVASPQSVSVTEAASAPGPATNDTRDMKHESAVLHVTGRALYIDDLPSRRDCCMWYRA